MKNKILICLCLVGILCMSLASCTINNDDPVRNDLSILVFSPTRIVPGGTISITGIGLDKTKSVTLAGNKVADFQVVSSNMLYCTVPASAAPTTGAVVVENGEEEAEAKTQLEIVLPTVTACNPNDIVDGGTNMTVYGNDLESVTEAVFPGDFVVSSVNFLRKSNHQIIIPVPMKVPTGEGCVTLHFTNGTSLTTPTVKFVKKRTGHYEDIDLAIYDEPFEVTYSKPLYIMKEWYSDWQVGMVISVYVRQKDSEKTEIKLLAGDGSEYKLPDPPFNNSIWYTKWTGSEVIKFVLTQKLWDDCWADEKLYKGRCFRFSGKNYYVDKVTIAATVWVWDDEE